MSRDEARDDSDIDILVSFDGPATSARYFGVQFYLEDLLGHPVDLVTDKAFRAELRPYASVRRCVSESRPRREWRFSIDDMIGFAEKVLS